MKNLSQHLFENETSSKLNPSAAFESSEDDVLVRIPGVILHLIEEKKSIELACGDFIIVRIWENDNVVAVLAHVGNGIQWQLARDEVVVKLDDSSYIFTLRAPPPEHDETTTGEDNLLNYWLTFASSKGQGNLLKELDAVLEQYCAFSVKKVEGEMAAKKVLVKDVSQYMISSFSLKNALEGETAAKALEVSPGRIKKGGDKEQLVNVFRYMPSALCCQFSLGEIEDATNNFDKILGHGGEGTVYLGQIPAIGLVAVKRLNSNLIEFEEEIDIVSKIKHPHLVSLLGYCNELGKKILVYEYMENGSLSNYIKKKRRSKICLSWQQRLNICLGAARGLQYLHKETEELPKGIIHRDIKPDNILLDDNWVAKLSDFGLCKLSHVGQEKSTMITSLKGTGGYYAPEYINYGSITRKLDVYSFGVVLFEVLCRKMPWDRGDESYYRLEDENLGIWARENVDPEINEGISEDCLEVFTHIIGRSLQQNPSLRPTMDDVVMDLESALKFQERQDEGIHHKAHTSRRKVSVPGSVRKTIKSIKQMNIKEITECGEDEIYEMLKECSMDPFQTIQKLLIKVRNLNEITEELQESNDTTVSNEITGELPECNDSIASNDTTEELPEPSNIPISPPSHETISKQFESSNIRAISTKEAVHQTVSDIFDDPGVQELLVKLYHKEWSEGQVTEYLVATFADYFTDVKMCYEEKSFGRVVEACLEETVVVYIDHLLSQKKYIKEETIERMRLDEEILMDFFREYISVTNVQTRLRILSDLRDLASAESPYSFTLVYKNILEHQPDCPADVVEKIVALREGIPRKDAEEVVQECQKIYKHSLVDGNPPKTGFVFTRVKCLSINKAKRLDD